MSLPTSYFTSTKNVEAMFEAMQTAGLPERFSYNFLKQLGFTSSSDRPFIAMLKALGFVDDSGVPTDRYRRYKDRPRSATVMGEAVRDAYSDVFAIDQSAHERSLEDLKGIFARLSTKGESVVSKMAASFKTLAGMAEFRPLELDSTEEEPSEDELPATPIPDSGGMPIGLHHDIHVHLPITTDIDVYHAIFRSLRENFG
jgi:hypothetical protein